MSTYDDTFFEYVNSGATRSAERILPLLLLHVEIGSVLDVGCGQGAWLTVYKSLGVKEITGLDGDYVDRDHLRIPNSSFVASDLSKGFDLGRRFDLVQSIEVAEHLPMTSAARFVDSLVQHGDLIMFSAAAKGQGGDYHINEQDYEYWRAHFARHGYVAIDYIRPLVLDDARIEPWYRYNLFLYASPARFEFLPIAIKQSRVSDGEKLRDISPPIYKLRKMLVRILPVPAATWLAKIKEKLVSRARCH